MARFIQFGAAAVALSLSLLLFGCASSAQKERATLLTLPYKEFDQTFGSGFRVLYDREEYLKGAVLIEDFLRRHPELTIGQQKFLHLHAGQLFALGKKYAPALKHFDQAVCHESAPEIGPDWNEMLAATSAFLKHDRPALIAIKEQLAAGSQRAHLADNFIENFESTYDEALLWHRLSPVVSIPKDASSGNQAAVEKVSKALGIPIVIADIDRPAQFIWIELRPFAPNSPLFGYVVIHAANGSLVTGSSQYWLDEGVERFIKLTRVRNRHLEAKFGLATNFDWIK
jgi:hypothetical protein